MRNICDPKFNILFFYTLAKPFKIETFQKYQKEPSLLRFVQIAKHLFKKINKVDLRAINGNVTYVTSSDIKMIF